MRHLDQYLLMKLVVVLSTAVVIVYFAALGYIDFTSPTTSTDTDTAETPSEAGQDLVAHAEYDAAIELYSDQIAALEAELVTANLDLAAAYASNQEPGDAEAVYRRVLRLDSHRKNAYAGLVEVLLDQKKVTDATTIVTAGLQLFPGDADLVALQARVREQVGQ